VSLTLLPERGRDLILAGAILSILLNPLFFKALDWLLARAEGDHKEQDGKPEPHQGAREEIPATTLSDHVVLVGHGRVGSFVSKALADTGTPLLVIELDGHIATRLPQPGIEAITGNAADPEVVRAANLAGARCLLVAIPDGFEGGQVVEQARAINPNLPIIARSHSDDETAHLKRHGATEVVMGEHEIAKAMVADACARLGKSADVPASWKSEGEAKA
jgi:monovalent cation:H+ antiporter-2, CPA2 family